jgi:hypothetical protein
MKMLRTRLTLSLIALAATTLFVSSCKDEDDGPANYFTFDGTTKTLETGYLFKDGVASEDGSGNVVYHHEVALVTEGLKPTSGTGNAVDFFMVASSSATELSAGTYSFSEKEGCDLLHYSLSTAMIDFSAVTEQGTEYDILSGTLTVAKSESTYTIDFEGTAAIDKVAANSKALKFHFVGPLTTGEK